MVRVEGVMGKGHLHTAKGVWLVERAMAFQAAGLSESAAFAQAKDRPPICPCPVTCTPIYVRRGAHS